MIARSPALTRALLAFEKELARGRFSRAFSEQVDIAVANENGCPYCLAAHTAAGRTLGLDERALADARLGHAADPKLDAGLTFAQSLVRDRGHVTDDDLAAVRAAGWTDGDVVELVGHVIAATLTNYLHHLSDVPIEFPRVEFASIPRGEQAA